MHTKEVKNRSAPGDRYHGKINGSCAYSINVITLKFGSLIKHEFQNNMIHVSEACFAQWAFHSKTLFMNKPRNRSATGAASIGFTALND